MADILPADAELNMSWRIFFLFIQSLFLIGCGPNKITLIEEREDLAVKDQQWLMECPPDLSHPLTLDEIIKIAVRNNLELYVKAAEINIQEDEANRLRFALLPQLNFDYQDTRRSQNAAARVELIDAPPSSPPGSFQLSSPKHDITWDISFIWNILDFGVTYFRARQQDDKAFIQIYEYERIKNSVILRSVQSYWRAVAAKQALDRANILLPEMREQTAKLNSEIEDRVYLSKGQALGKLIYFNQREIQVLGYNDRNDSSDPTQGYEKEYINALLDLAQLMQIPPGSQFDVYVPEDNLPYQIDNLPVVNDLFNTALVNRPELYERDLEYKISADDVKIAIIEQFPSVQLFNIKNFDSNPFLLHNNWYQAGVRMAWNLLAYPQHLMEYYSGKDEEERDIRNRLLLSESVLTQVTLAYILYEQNKDQYLLAKRVADSYKQAADLSILESEVGKKSKLEALQAKIDYALARNNLGKIYAELQRNIEQLNNAIGIPLYFSTFRNIDLLEQGFNKLEYGCYD